MSDLLKKANAAFAQNGKLLITDAWDLPVVDLKVRFEGEAGAIIKAAVEKK